MKVGPLVRPQHRPAAILVPSNRALEVTTTTGTHTYNGAAKVHEAMAQLRGHSCYVLKGLTQLIHTTGALSWQCHLWRGRETRMVHNASGTSVTSLRGTLDHSTDPFGDLSMVLDWLASYNVPAGAIPAMAWSLFRSTLDHELTIGFDPQVGHAALFGGRQEAYRPTRHENMASYDIRAAYPVAMASRPYALSLRPAHVKSQLDPFTPGIARARVYVPPELPYAPLPVRIGPGIITFQHGQIEGTWAWCELEAARSLGCDVRIEELWAPRRVADLFGPWWPIIADGRKLPGAAGVLAKAIANSTWGQFGMVAEQRAVRSWTTDNGRQSVDVQQPPRGLPHEYTAHISGETAARIRTRVLVEGLYSGCQPVYVDTDGIIVAEGSPMPTDSGNENGQWRVKATMPVVEIRGAQFYRFTCGSDCGTAHAEWHYNCSGVPDEEAPAMFANMKQPDVDVVWGVRPPPADLAAIGESARQQQVAEQ